MSEFKIRCVNRNMNGLARTTGAAEMRSETKPSGTKADAFSSTEAVRTVRGCDRKEMSSVHSGWSFATGLAGVVRHSGIELRKPRRV
jgi:hypothetical protein